MKKHKRKGTPMLNQIMQKWRGKPGITIGRPIKDRPMFANQMQIDFMFRELRDRGYAVDERDLWGPRGASIIAGSRNLIVEGFLARDGKNGPRHEYLLFIDDDQSFPLDSNPADWVQMLIDDDKDIVGAMTVRKWAPFNPNIGIYNGEEMKQVGRWPENELFRVHQIGFGMVLVKRKVIEDLYHRTDPPSPIFFDPIEYEPLRGAVSLRGEDYRFCIESMRLGYDLWVDPRIPLLHIGEYHYGIEDYKYVRENKMKPEDIGIDLCQHTHLYAELADKLRKSSPQSRKDPENLSDAARVALQQKESIAGSKLPDSTSSTPPTSTPTQT
ncbi:MAG: hypothetical protein WC356_03820 [Candidatus Micrarchaeia archaeon]